jgi:acetyl-CoA carboxylase biotin carboxyl carrier protein
MADHPSGPTEPLDVKRIHYLVRLMRHYDLTALDLVDGAVQIRLRRRGPEPAHSPAASPSPAHLPAALNAAAGPASPPGRPEPAVPAPASSAKTVLIESPMVGTYYASSAPDAPSFVTNGSVVHPDTIVGIIEAMKVFTEIPANVSGTIVEILAKNGQPVEFGQPLFRVLPA